MINITNKNQKLPAGLVNKSVEFFIHNDLIFCIYDGKIYAFDDTPPNIITIIEDEMKANSSAMKAMNAWGIQTKNEKIKQYIACRFGKFDANPDIDADGQIRHSEYTDCGRRGKCPYENKICAPMTLKNGVLSKKDIRILKLIGANMLDKQICAALNITTEVLRGAKKRLCASAGLESKTALAVLAHKLNLL